MAGTVGKLNVLVGASIGGLKSGLKGAAKLVGGFKNSVKDKVGELGGMLAGAGISAAGIGLGLKLAGESIDATAKSAERLGISIESFVGLKHAASLANVPVEMLAAGLTKMEDNLATAARTGGPVEKTLNSIGLTSKELIDVAPDVAFAKIADGIMSIENPSLRTAAAMDIFGKAGAMMLPLLQEGSAGFAKATAEAKRFGLVFTPTQAAQVDAFGDAWDKVGEAIKGGFMQSLIEIAPHLTALVEQSSFTLADIGQNVGKFVGRTMTEISFLSNNWSLHWELITTSVAVQLDRMKALAQGTLGAIGKAFDIFRNNWVTILNDLGNKLPKEVAGVRLTAGADITSIMGGIKNIGNPFKPLTGDRRGKSPWQLFKEGFQKTEGEILEGLPSVLKSNAEVAKKLWDDVGEAFNETLNSSTDMALQTKLKELVAQLAKAREKFDESAGKMPLKTGGPITGGAGLKKATGITGVASQLAAATQLGTTEAASQITAAMTAFNRKDDELVDLTKQQNNTLVDIRKAIEDRELEFDMIPAFI